MAAEEEATSGEVDCTPSPPKESPPAKRAKVGPKVDVASTESVFTPARKGRVKKRIRGLSDGPLRGGEFVANVDKNFCTLSFCFAKTESDDSGKEVTTWYGVTAGHLAEKGDSIYVCTGVLNAQGNPILCKAGQVVSKSAATDSLIFSIKKDDRIEVMDMLLAENSGLRNDAFNLPDEGGILENGVLLIGFGAQRRGAVGKVSTPCLAHKGTSALAGDIGITDRDGTSQLTDDGDCGAIFICESGDGWYMHHVLRTYGDGRNESFGVPLKSIFKAHSLLGGADEAATTKESHQSSPGKSDFFESHNILHIEDVTFEKTGDFSESHNLAYGEAVFE
jgi:hypothetical protein